MELYSFRTKIFQSALMQIWKFHCMFGFIWKLYPENFAFLIPRIFELLTCNFCYFLTYSLVSVCLKINISDISGAFIWKSKPSCNVKPLAYYFYMKTNISVEFHICIGVPSSPLITFKKAIRNWILKKGPCVLCKLYLDDVGFVNLNSDQCSN